MSRTDGPQYAGDLARIDTLTPPKLVRMWNGSGASIAKGVAVMEDVSVTTAGLGGAVKISTADAAGGRGIIGGAYETIPNLTFGLIQVEGVQADVSVIDGTATGDLSGSLTTAGRLIVNPLTAGIRTVARNLAAPAGNLSTVRWMNPHAL